MDKLLLEFFDRTHASDIFNDGYGEISDFLSAPHEVGAYDWVITNPPFEAAEAIVQRALPIARSGIAILARTVFIESAGRFERLFLERPPVAFA